MTPQRDAESTEFLCGLCVSVVKSLDMVPFLQMHLIPQCLGIV